MYPQYNYCLEFAIYVQLYRIVKPQIRTAEIYLERLRVCIQVNNAMAFVGLMLATNLKNKSKFHKTWSKD